MTEGTSITKKCEICGEIKYIGEFSKSYRNRCKKCVAEQERNMRELRKIAKTGAFGFACEVKSVEKQLALETIKESVNILTNEIIYMFVNVPSNARGEIVSQIVNNYHKKITEWMDDKTKNL